MSEPGEFEFDPDKPRADEFKHYLSDSKLMDLMTSALAKLYEMGDKPQSSQEFCRNFFADSDVDVDAVLVENTELAARREELRIRLAALEACAAEVSK
jgi:hypothetical protein